MAPRTLRRICLAIVLQLAWAVSLLAQALPPTFSKDVAPILQKNCQSCHRPGEGGPFPLLTYSDAKLMSSSIKRVVSQKIMPPWYADPKFGHFSNDRSMSATEIATLVAWVNAGAPEGDPKGLPPPINWVEG
jgi:mono/diheme cytochrome c family protein